MRRRRLLAALATGSVALAGCAQQDTTGDDGTTPEDTPATPDDKETPDGKQTPDTPGKDISVTVDRVRVLPEVVALDSPDSIGTYGDRGQQYLLAKISTDGGKLARGDLRVVAGDASHNPLERLDGHRRSIWEYGELYFVDDNTAGWVVFALPNPLSITDGETLELAWPGGAQQLDDDTRTRLSQGPTSFAVSVDASEEASMNSPATLSVTVENTGDVPGTFVGALNRIGPRVAHAPVEAVELDVSPGEQVTWTHKFELDRETVENGRDRFDFRFKWRDSSETRTVQVVEE